MPKLFENKDVNIRGGTFSIDHLEYQSRLVDDISAPYPIVASVVSTIFDIVCLAISLYGDLVLKRYWKIAAILLSLYFLVRLVGDIRRYIKSRFAVDLTMKPGGRIVKAIFGDKATASLFCDVLKEQCELASKAFESV